MDSMFSETALHLLFPVITWVILIFIAYREWRGRHRLTEEIRQRDVAEQSARERERYLKALTEVNRLLLTHVGFRETYEGILRILGEASGASRVYIFENHLDDANRLLTSQRAEWCAPDIPSQINNPSLQNLPVVVSEFGRLGALLAEGKVVAAKGNDLPESLQSTRKPLDILSILILPILVGGRFFGFIGFDQCDREREWEESEIYLLQAAALTFSQHIERQQVSEESARQSLQLRTLLDSLPGYAFLKDTEGRYLLANREFCRDTGLAEGEITGKTDADIFPPALAAKYRSDDLTVISTGRELSIEEGPGVDREQGRVLSTRKVPLRDQYDVVTGIVGLCIDISHRKRVEQEVQCLNAELEERVRKRTEELQQANEELEAFCHTVSHDLRGPLTGIRGFSQLLLEELEYPAGAELDYIQRVLDITDRTLQLLNDLLGLSRAARTDLQHDPVDLSTIVETIAADLQLQYPERQVRFVIQKNVSTVGDENLLRVVLNNLINNAWKYTSKKQTAEIRFFTLPLKEETVYCIRDDGAGFRMTYVDRLFQAFSRLHTAHEFPGTGVGLATVRRIVQRHNGRVWAEGEEGKGASFYFTLQ